MAGMSEVPRITLTCQGYSAVAEYYPDAKLYHGRLLGIQDVVTFEGADVESARAALAESVRDYLDFCRQRGEAPNEP